ncbi:transient receptor potential cation channel subfamily a member 1-like [Gigaspora margarita]|uniref:Transient receptor potential cation channel subfamily a member 1-like n=1 Tax=Gigaspora margarita TaxID=4874 RepID=A0A8H4APV2_GIGMA|nr:transient receptor potential cation channel subfamily a member 1-like [Gigaspora margarita]
MNKQGEFSQASMSKDEETIEMEDESPKPHKGEEITKLVLSPNGKYAVTWNEDGISICGWQLDQLVEQSVNQSEKQSVEQLEDELHQSKHFEFDCSMLYFGEDAEISTVSNNKLVAILSVMAGGYYETTDISFGTIEVIDLSKEKKERIELELEIESDYGYNFVECRFDNNGDLLIVSYENYGFNIYKISFKNLHNDKQIWKINNSILCGTNKEVMRCHIMVCQINDEEKIILSDKCGSLAQWNLNLLFEKQYQLNVMEANCSICIFNRDVTLLVVYCDRIIYVYLTENSLLLSRSKVSDELHHLEFISPGKEERLLLFNDLDSFKLEDPYHLPDVIEFGIIKSIKELCGSLLELLNKETLKQAEFITVKYGKIYYILEGRLWEQEISGELWAKYLRKEFKEYNEIRTLPSKFHVENVLQKFISEYEEDKSQFLYDDGSLVKWEVNTRQKIIQAFWKIDSKLIDSIRLIHEIRGLTIFSCKILNNEDLAMITNEGIFIWSIWQKYEKKRIRLRYYITLNCKNMKKSDFEQLLNNMQAYKGKDSLPTPDFDFLMKNVERFSIQSDESDKRYLFKEFLDDYIEDKILMKLYGQELLKCCLKLKKYSMIGILFNNIYKKMENSDFLLKIQYLDIFTSSFIELTHFPQFLKEFLLHTLFIHSADSFEEIKFNKFLSDPHLQNHITYTQPYFKNNIRQNIKKFFTILKKDIPFFNTIKNIKNEKIYKDSQVIILIFPLPKFSSYNNTYNPWKELIFPDLSVFSKHQFPELYKYWHGEALLNFKWNTYGKYYFFVIFIFYFIFMFCFLIVAMIKELSNNTRNLLLFTTIILGILHLIFEIRQFIYFPLPWITNIWNYFDIGAILFPTLTSIDWLQSSTTPIWAITISILLLGLKFITFFRAIEFGGTHWVMIIEVIQYSLLFFVIIGFIMFAFAHSLRILLRQTIDTSNDLNNLEESDTNMFTNLDTAYLAVYMMLTSI